MVIGAVVFALGLAGLMLAWPRVEPKRVPVRIPVRVRVRDRR